MLVNRSVAHFEQWLMDFMATKIFFTNYSTSRAIWLQNIPEMFSILLSLPLPLAKLPFLQEVGTAHAGNAAHGARWAQRMFQEVYHLHPICFFG